jgi:hypothetical protein
MSLHLKMPYKVVTLREKRYDAHYGIPSKECVIVPLRALDDEALCDIRWEDANGELQVIHNKMFVAQNLEPLNPLLHTKQYELWEHYYHAPSSAQETNGASAPGLQ